MFRIHVPDPWLGSADTRAGTEASKTAPFLCTIIFGGNSMGRPIPGALFALRFRSRLAPPKGTVAAAACPFFFPGDVCFGVLFAILWGGKTYAAAARVRLGWFTPLFQRPEMSSRGPFSNSYSASARCPERTVAAAACIFSLPGDVCQRVCFGTIIFEHMSGRLATRKSFFRRFRHPLATYAINLSGVTYAPQAASKLTFVFGGAASKALWLLRRAFFPL